MPSRGQFKIQKEFQTWLRWWIARQTLIKDIRRSNRRSWLEEYPTKIPVVEEGKLRFITGKSFDESENYSFFVSYRLVHSILLRIECHPFICFFIRDLTPVKFCSISEKVLAFGSIEKSAISCLLKVNFTYLLFLIE